MDRFENACLPAIIRSTMEAHPDLIEYYNHEDGPNWYFINGLNSLMEPGEQIDDIELMYRLLKLLAWTSGDALCFNEDECFDLHPERPFVMAKDVKFDDMDRCYRFDHIGDED